MTIATTTALIISTIDGVSGVSNVYDGALTKTLRSTLEAARGIASGQTLQSWEVFGVPRTVHGGADGYRTTELDVEVLAHYKHDEANASLSTFRSLLASVMDAIGAAFPQLREEGVVPVEMPDMPVMLGGSHSAWRARFRFGLWDVNQT